MDAETLEKIFNKNNISGEMIVGYITYIEYITNNKFILNNKVLSLIDAINESIKETLKQN